MGAKTPEFGAKTYYLKMKEIGLRGGRMSLVPPSPDPTIENGSFGNILWNCVNYHL